MAEKRYYWIKLREDLFKTDQAFDILMSEKNGAEYIVLYQMLCLKTINTGGRFETKIGEVIIPYNVEKIARDCRYFSVDTVRIALGLYMKLGLIYIETDGCIRISNYNKYLGSESASAERMRKLREKENKALQCDAPSISSQSCHNVTPNVTQDIRYIENRDKISKEEEKETSQRDAKKKKESVNVTPSQEGLRSSLVSTIINSQKKDSEKALTVEAVKELLFTLDIDPTCFDHVWQWLLMRRKRRNPATLYALELAVKKAKEISKNDPETISQIFDQSTLRGWSGVFALRDKDKPGQENPNFYDQDSYKIKEVEG